MCLIGEGWKPSEKRFENWGKWEKQGLKGVLMRKILHGKRKALKGRLQSKKKKEAGKFKKETETGVERRRYYGQEHSRKNPYLGREKHGEV